MESTARILIKTIWSSIVFYTNKHLNEDRAST